MLKSDESLVLFRRQAVAAFSSPSNGPPLAKCPISWSTLGIVFLIFVVSGLAFASTGSFARKERVTGAVKIQTGTSAITSSSHAIVLKVLVHEGQKVKKGDPLLTLSHDTELLTGSSVANVSLQQLNRQIIELSKQRQVLDEIYSNRIAARRRDSNFLDLELSSLDHQIKRQSEIIALANSSLARVKQAASKNAISQLEANRFVEQQLIHEVNLDVLHQKRISLVREKNALELEIRSAPGERKNQLAEIERTLAELTEKLATAKARTQSVIRSPRNGLVENIQLVEGSSVSPSEMMLAVLSASSRYEAEVYVPSRAIGFVSPKQRVRLMYDAFPHEKYGVFGASVDHVSSSSVHQRSNASNGQPEEPTYKVVLKLDRQYVEAHGQRYPLRDGMLLTAEIVMEQRSFLEWLLRPLLDRRRTA